MSNSIEAALRAIDGSVKPTARDCGLFHLRAGDVAESLTRSNVSEHCRLVGSVARSTALRHYSDIDLLAVIDLQDTQSANPRSAIAVLGDVLADFGFEVATDEFTASVSFGQPPAVDVIPAILQSREGSYLVPSGRDNKWQEFRPALLESLTAHSSRRLGSRFLAVVRLIKFWNMVCGARFQSSDLEELANVALGKRDRIDSYSESLAWTLGVCIDWIRGDVDTQLRMGRSFTSQPESQDVVKLEESFALGLEMSEPRHARGAANLTEEFFGGKVAQYLR